MQPVHKAPGLAGAEAVAPARRARGTLALALAQSAALLLRASAIALLVAPAVVIVALLWR